MGWIEKEFGWGMGRVVACVSECVGVGVCRRVVWESEREVVCVVGAFTG